MLSYLGRFSSHPAPTSISRVERVYRIFLKLPFWKLVFKYGWPFNFGASLPVMMVIGVPLPTPAELRLCPIEIERRTPLKCWRIALAWWGVGVGAVLVFIFWLVGLALNWLVGWHIFGRWVGYTNRASTIYSIVYFLSLSSTIFTFFLFFSLVLTCLCKWLIMSVLSILCVIVCWCCLIFLC